MKKEHKKSLFDRTVAWIHLWPSIVSGVIVVFVCITGTMIVYTDEIMDLTAGDAKYVETGTQRITSDQIVAKLKRAYPGYIVSEFVFFKDPGRSIRLRSYNPKERMLSMIYMDPYTGDVLKKDDTIYIFFVTAHLHASLLAGEAGHWIVVISTIIFVLSCLTGLVLWWPKKWNRTTRLSSFTVRWKARFKRLNYDLHNVFGFYSLILSLVLSVTGLMIFFPSLMNIVVKAAGGDVTELRDILPKMDSSRTSVDMVPLAYRVLEEEHTDKEMVSIWNFDMLKLGAYAFTSGNVGLKSIENSDLDIYDRYSGQKITIDKKQLRHEKAENTVWQLHMGQWWGQVGKLSTFLTGVVATSLPITGFIIWWSRRSKNNNNKPGNSTIAEPSKRKKLKMPRPKIQQ